MKYKLVIFDMDGTILNTLTDIKNCINYALVQAGFPERSLEEVRKFVGNGLHKLVERAVPEGTDNAKIENVFSILLEYYKLHCSDNTKPYDGIPELIKELRVMGYKTAVVSNKADFAVKDLVDTFFEGLFDISVGDREGINKKPAPDSVYEVLRMLNIEKENAVYIGDSEVDVATASNAGIDSIIVEWGFRDREFLEKQGAKVFVNTTKQLIDLLR